MKIMVVTMWGDDYKDLADISVPNMVDYCNRNGYYPYQITLGSSKNVWYKKHETFNWMLEMDIDAIFYKDVDTLFTNFKHKIEDFIDNEHHYFLTRDFNELNNGVCIIRNTKEAKALNNLILAQRKDFPNEQNALNWWIKYLHPSLIKVVCHPSFNSYKYSEYKECSSWVGKPGLGDWEEGESFVLHVPGLSLERRLEVLKNTPIIK